MALQGPGLSLHSAVRERLPNPASGQCANCAQLMTVLLLTVRLIAWGSGCQGSVSSHLEGKHQVSRRTRPKGDPNLTTRLERIK